MLYARHNTHANFDFWKFKIFFSSSKRGANAFSHSSHVVRGLEREISDHWLPRIFKSLVLISLFQTFWRQTAQSVRFLMKLSFSWGCLEAMCLLVLSYPLISDLHSFPFCWNIANMKYFCPRVLLLCQKFLLGFCWACTKFHSLTFGIGSEPQPGGRQEHRQLQHCLLQANRQCAELSCNCWMASAIVTLQVTHQKAVYTA